MPNGSEISKEEFFEIESFFDEIDNVLNQFKNKHHAILDKNYHNIPSRTLEWGVRIKKSIGINAGLRNRQIVCTLGIIAYIDKADGRYAKSLLIRKYEEVEELKKELNQVLEESFNIVDAWREDDLQKC